MHTYHDASFWEAPSPPLLSTDWLLGFDGSLCIKYSLKRESNLDFEKLKRSLTPEDKSLGQEDISQTYSVSFQQKKIGMEIRQLSARRVACFVWRSVHNLQPRLHFFGRLGRCD
jgi:hypothetical protein